MEKIEDSKGKISMKKILSGLLALFLFLNYGCSLNDTEKYLQELKSENVMVRNNAIYYLGENKEKLAVPMLIELLNNDQPKEIRLNAIEALGKIEEAISVEALVALLNEEDKEIKMAAVEALGKIKDPKAVKPLINVLNNKDIKITALWAIGNIGDKSAIPHLTKLFDDQDEYVRYNASQSLKKIGYDK
jgi:HEAT repeat protein